MRIERISIAGFGRLTNREHEFAPRLNVVFGPNESGKSTLHLAILSALYGFHQSTRARAAENELLRQFRPWSSDDYAISMEYRLDDGKRYRVERSFEPLLTALWDRDRALDVSSNYPQGRHGYVAFAKSQWGLDKELFTRTVFVSQGAIRDLGDREETTSAILALLESGTGDGTVSQAVERLDRTIVAEIGRTDRAYQKPLPKARTRLRKVIEEKEKIESAQASIQEWEEQRQIAECRVSELEAAIDGLDRVQIKEQRHHIQERLRRHASLAEELRTAQADMEALSDYATFESSRYEELMQLSERREATVERLDSLEQEITKQSAERETALRERDALLVERDRLEHTHALTPTLIRQVEDTLRNWRLIGEQVAQEEARLVRARDRMREIGARLRDKRSALRLLRKQGQVPFATLCFEWDRANRQAQEKREAYDLATGKLVEAGSSIEEALQLAALREKVSLDVEQRLRSAHQQSRAPSETTELSAQKPKPSAKPAWIPWRLLGLGLVVALVFFALLLVVGREELAGPVALAIMAVWSLAAIIIRALKIRPQQHSRPAQGTESDRRPTPGEVDDADVGMASSAQTAVLEQLGFPSWQNLERDLQRYASLAGRISTYVHRRDELQSAEELVASARDAIDVVLGKVGLDTWNDATLAELESDVRQAEGLLEQSRPLRESIKDSRTSLASLRTRHHRLEITLDSLLSQAELPVLPLPERIEAFSSWCAQRDETAICINRLAITEERLARFDIPVVARQESSERIVGIETQMRALLDESGIGIADDLDLVQACREYALRADRKSAFDQTEDRAAALQRSIDSLLSGATVAGLEQELASLEERLAALEDRLSDSESSAKELDRAKGREQIRKERDTCEKTITELEERIRAAKESHRSVTEVEEEIAFLESKISTLESYRRSLDRAKEVLQEAAEEYHREISPRLQSILNDNLSFVTNGKYKEAIVGVTDLSLGITVPETGSMQAPEVLSYGTQDELYVLLRTAIAQLMGNEGETIPIMLDDPFVNFDADRLTRMLELLVRLAERYQVFLFTKDNSIRDWFNIEEPIDSSIAAV